MNQLLDKKKMRDPVAKGDACQRCWYWQSSRTIARGKPLCACTISSKYLVHTGAADHCALFRSRAEVTGR